VYSIDLLRDSVIDFTTRCFNPSGGIDRFNADSHDFDGQFSPIPETTLVQGLKSVAQIVQRARRNFHARLCTGVAGVYPSSDRDVRFATEVLVQRLGRRDSQTV
jgi:hypothetical protein